MLLMLTTGFCCWAYAEHLLSGSGTQCNKFYWLLEGQPLGESCCVYSSRMHAHAMLVCLLQQGATCSFLQEFFSLVLLSGLFQSQPFHHKLIQVRKRLE